MHAIAMNHVESEHKRHAQARAHRTLLKSARDGYPADLQHSSDESGFDALLEVQRAHHSGCVLPGLQHQLPNPLCDRHLAEKLLDARLDNRILARALSVRRFRGELLVTLWDGGRFLRGFRFREAFRQVARVRRRRVVRGSLEVRVQQSQRRSGQLDLQCVGRVAVGVAIERHRQRSR